MSSINGSPVLHMRDIDTQHWIPHLFDAALPTDQNALTALLASGAAAFVHDTIVEQLNELIETREATRDLEPEELRERVNTHIGTSDLSCYGTWVYYPWSHRLVHVLPEEEFWELRTSRNRNKIAAFEQAKAVYEQRAREGR